jgi:MYXO-CTERM domain-containing protein
VATLPMRFSFEPVAYYERAMVDGHSDPQSRTVPLQGKPPLVESVDVGFLDPGSGQIQKRTKFSFSVTRGHGYEAGEYDVTIKDGRTDATIGSVAHIEFDGDNEVIDRRAIVFTGDKKAKKEDKPADQTDDSAPKKKELTPDDPDYWKGGPKTDDSENQEKVEPKSGCGCHVGTSPAAPSIGSLVLMVGLLGARRIRRNRRQTDAST